MEINWDAASAVANIFMAVATFIVIYISLMAGKREREFRRLREKMFFYSNLMAGFEPTHTNVIHFFNYLQKNEEIQQKYPALVERDLYVLLEHIIPAAQSHDEGSFLKVQELVDEAMKIIQRDFYSLQQKYDQF